MYKLTIAEDNAISVGTRDNLVRDAFTGEAVGDATIVAQLKAEDGETEIGDPIEFEPSEEVIGIYHGTLPESVSTDLVLDAYYWLDVSVVGSGTGFRRVKCQAAYHGEQP